MYTGYFFTILSQCLLYYVFFGQYDFTESASALNITNSCNQQQGVFCTLFNLTETYNEKLLWANSTQTELLELIIRSSQLRSIPRGIFTSAPKLRSLLCLNCGIKFLDRDDFREAQSLQKLLLQGNSFFILPEQIFTNLYNLEELYFAQNTLQKLHGKAFSNLRKLRHLDLQQNSIEALPLGLFDELVSLEHIDLSGNKITEINEHTFAKNMQLHTVILADNKFTVFQPRSLEHLTHLNLLDISNSDVDRLNIQSVDILLAQGSGLSMCAIKGSVIKLYASNNHLTTGSLQIGNKLSLFDLDLHANQISSLNDLTGMLNLQRLDVSKNQLTTLDIASSPLYLPLPSLTYLNVASNLLGNLSADAFLFLGKLNYLDLAFNRLQQLDHNVFKPLVNLEKFYIEGTNIYDMNYEEFCKNHKKLREIGIFNNEYDQHFARKTLAFFQNHHILLPVRFISTTLPDVEDTRTDLNAMISPMASPRTMNFDFRNSQQEPKLLEVPGIHPYWTNRDVLTMVILCIVFLILLLQMYRLLQEEPCFRNCCRRTNGHRTIRGTLGGIANRPQRLNEDDSEI